MARLDVEQLASETSLDFLPPHLRSQQRSCGKSVPLVGTNALAEARKSRRGLSPTCAAAPSSALAEEGASSACRFARTPAQDRRAISLWTSYAEQRASGWNYRR